MSEYLPCLVLSCIILYLKGMPPIEGDTDGHVIQPCSHGCIQGRRAKGPREVALPPHTDARLSRFESVPKEAQEANQQRAQVCHSPLRMLRLRCRAAPSAVAYARFAASFLQESGSHEQ